MRQRHLARLYRMLEMVMASACADKAPAIRFQLSDEVT